MNRRTTALSRGLAAAFLDGPWNLDGLVARGADALGRRVRGLRRLASAVMQRFPEAPTGQLGDLAAFVHGKAKLGAVRHIHHWHTPQPAMAVPLPAFKHLALASLTCTAELATWLGVDPANLVWFADEHRHLRRAAAPRLRHYYYAWIRKRSGAYRLLEAPRPRLKAIQRQILRGIIDLVPPHEATHGFRRHRSVLTNASLHTNRDVVLRIDLADFFAAVTEARVGAIFRSLGYPDTVARTLAALCCTPTPIEVLAARPLRQTPTDNRERHTQRLLLAGSHLPQGGPSSPALANLAAFRLDRRLVGLALKWDARYTRYADDLVFSGNRRLGSQATSFIGTVGAIASEEGFAVRFRKTRVMHRAVRQQIGGIVVNERPGLPRDELKQLEAILYNCVRHGAAQQNRAAHPNFRAHLAGRVSWAECAGPAARAARLRSLFEQIVW